MLQADISGLICRRQMKVPTSDEFEVFHQKEKLLNEEKKNSNS